MKWTIALEDVSVLIWLLSFLVQDSLSTLFIAILHFPVRLFGLHSKSLQQQPKKKVYGTVVSFKSVLSQNAGCHYVGIVALRFDEYILRGTSDEEKARFVLSKASIRSFSGALGVASVFPFADPPPSSLVLGNYWAQGSRRVESS